MSEATYDLVDADGDLWRRLPSGKLVLATEFPTPAEWSEEDIRRKWGPVEVVETS